MSTDDASTTSAGAATALAPVAQAVASDADSHTSAAVTTLGLVQQARLSSQNRAVNAAISAYGKDSSQAASAAQAVTVTRAASARLTVLQAQVATPAPTVAPAGWALHGHVYDSALSPQESYTVFLVDAQKNYLSQYGFSYTDSTGYYLINYDANANQSATGSQTQAGGANATASETPAPAAQQPSPEANASAQSAAPQIFLQVADANGNPVLLSQMSFTPVTGQAVYQDITLAAGAAKLGDPPADVRAVAMPPGPDTPAKTPPAKTKGKSS